MKNFLLTILLVITLIISFIELLLNYITLSLYYRIFKRGLGDVILATVVKINFRNLPKQ